VRAESLGGLLAEAGRGLFAVIAGDLAQIRPVTRRSFTVPGTDPAWLLLDWTTELLAAFDLERLLLCEFEVAVEAAGARGHARGERYDPARHTLAHEIKAVTQHGLDVRRTAAGWEGTVIVDI